MIKNNLYVFGIDYKNNKSNLLSRLVFTKDEITSTLERIKISNIAVEGLILSTCNRVEIYVITNDIDFVINAICEIKNICPRNLKPSLYIYKELECVQHIFQVASGAKSMAFGETEIVSQIKDAITFARNANMLSNQLTVVFELALKTQKEVRNSNILNNISTSFNDAIICVINNNIKQFIKPRLLILGAGSIIKSIFPVIKLFNFDQIKILNRNIEKALLLSSMIGCTYDHIDTFLDNICAFDIIISGIDSREQIINLDAINNRINGANKLIIDLSFQGINNTSTDSCNNISYFSLNDLGNIIDVNNNVRHEAIVAIQYILEENIEIYKKWQRKRELIPIIRDLHSFGENIRHECLDIAKRNLQNGYDIDYVLENLSKSIVNKILHKPTTNLCSSDLDDNDLKYLVNHLYDLKLHETKYH